MRAAATCVGASPGADVAGVSAVPVPMWQGRAQSRCGCGRGEPRAGTAGPAVTKKGSCGPGNDTCNSHGTLLGRRRRSARAFAAVKSSSYLQYAARAAYRRWGH